MSDSGGRSSNGFQRQVGHEQRRTGPTPSAASGGRPQVVSLVNLPRITGSRPSGPSIATTQSPSSPSHNIPQHLYWNNYHFPYLSHPAFPSFAHVEAVRFPPAIQYPPRVQGTRPPRTHVPYIPSTSPLNASLLPPLGSPSYHYPPPVLYNRTQQIPPFSTPVSPYIHPQRSSEWAPIPFQRPPTTPQRSDSDSQFSSTPISSVSTIYTQPSEHLTPPPSAAANANMGVVNLVHHPQERRLFFSSAPVEISRSRSRKERPVEIPARPCSAPAFFPATGTDAPHDARSRPTVPVTQCSEATELEEGRLPPDLPHSRTTGRRHKQTPYVLWMGNIPNDATEGELDAFLSQPDNNLDPNPPRHSVIGEARVPFCSIFLMAKSNCAFVNYNSKEELLQAVQQFHGRRLRPNMRVRLVCRIRTKEKGEQQSPTEHPPTPILPGLPSRNSDVPVPTTSGSKRFFILKSVTHVDLLLSVRHGYWCTRRHNETTMNHAHNSVDHVYLIFGVNKSGEFFGYARMASAIFDDQGNRVVDPSVTWPPHTSPISPSGQSQSASGSQSTSGSQSMSSSTSANTPPPSDQFQPSSSASSTSSILLPTYGAPFQVEWIRTIPLPFDQVKHLKNPWNGNHEIKASRDGTELPPALGQKMLDEWEQYIAEIANAAK